MYTLVLAAFLTTGTEVPDWGCRGGCHGCWGGCRGCWGGCYGCWGGCYGCWGGCYGCGGGCWGGCYGCWGGCYGCGGGCFGCFGCGGGCFGCGGGYGGMAVVPAASAPVAPPVARSAAPPVTQTLQDLKKSIEELKNEQNKLREELRRRSREAAVPPTQTRSELPDPQRGKLLLEMPADALIVVNDKRINADSAYLTPPLEPGKEQVLNVEAAVVRDGRSINRVKRLSVHGGEVVRLAYEDMESADGRWTKNGDRAPSPAHITVHLPADARLTVDGVDCPLTSDTRTFDTPALEPGQKYYYLLKAEVVRDGQPIAQTRRVDFRSGERVTVSFEDLGANRVTAR